MTEAAQILESKTRKISPSSQPTQKTKISQRDIWEGTKLEDQVPAHGTGENIHILFYAYI